MKKILTYILFSFILLSACKKDGVNNEINLANQKIADKMWKLNYSQAITSTSTTEKSYYGQSTYFIKFLKNKTTIDSDGLTGVYSVEKVNGILQIHVNAKTKSLNNVEYVYDVESIGDNNLILYYTASGITYKFYYNASN